MAQTARCPSCGAPVEFKSLVSILAVCDFCQSTLVREGDALANLGRMAALVEDHSPLQRGAEGRWRGRHFTLIGRIQMRWEQGLWNEWHLLFDDGKSGWLSESGGEFVVSEPVWQPGALPVFAALHVGDPLTLAGHEYSITNLLTAECVAGEGELPFKVGSGYPAPVADLRDAEGRFATLDYSDSEGGAQPLVFLGESVPFASLAWNNLKSGVPIPEITVKARAFNCPACAAPLAIKHAHIETFGCGSCGAVLDTRNETVQLIARASAQLTLEPRLPLGSRGKLRGEDVEVIGFMRRRMRDEGIDYYWSEYVLLGRDNRLLWLTESDGHWTFAAVLSRTVQPLADKIAFEKQVFKHFQTYRAMVDYVIGEFPWRVQIDESTKVEDFVAPPLMLSRETTEGEVTWTRAEYIDAAEIGTALGLKKPLPAARGVYANQPNPHEESHARMCSRFWKLLAVALVVHLVLMAGGPGGRLLKESMTFDGHEDEPKLTKEFRLTDGARRLRVAHTANVNNNWIDLNLTLVNKDTGQAWPASRSISRYEGVDGGESWSEGSRDDEVVFADLPPGTYFLAEEADLDANSPPVRTELTVARAGPRWSSLLLLLLFLAAFPIYTRVRKAKFEVKRWAESDHPIVTSSDDDSDD